MTVGNLWVWTERSTWNPVAGLGDVYSVDIWRNLHDSATARHPFTGIPMPFRAAYEVETAGPAASSMFRPAPPGGMPLRERSSMLDRE